MRKKSICLFVILAFFVAVSAAFTALRAGAEGLDWEPDEELSRILTYDELTVVPESVLPVYWMDTVSFAETGIFAPMPLICSQDGGDIYIAKVLTKDGKFAGNLQFCVHGGSAHFRSMSLSVATTSEPTDAEKHSGSCSLADNAARFEALFGKPVSTETVQFVLMEGIGDGFYFPEERALVYLAREGKEGAPEGNEAPVDNEALLEDAKHYKAYREEKEQWAMEHPGEMLLGYTGGADTGTGLGFRVPVWAWGPLAFGSTAGVWLLARRYQERKRNEWEGTV